VHDILKLARFLLIPLDEIEAAALRDELPESPPVPRRDAEGKVPLLEQAIELFAWTDEQAAAALQTTRERVRSWRRGVEPMPLPELMTVAALVALHAAGAAGGSPRIADVAQALAGSAQARAPQRSG
jgi:hypothetical protein